MALRLHLLRPIVTLYLRRHAEHAYLPELPVDRSGRVQDDWVQGAQRGFRRADFQRAESLESARRVPGHRRAAFWPVRQQRWPDHSRVYAGEVVRPQWLRRIIAFALVAVPSVLVAQDG